MMLMMTVTRGEAVSKSCHIILYLRGILEITICSIKKVKKKITGFFST
jgi:hypothetical protein